MGGNRGKLFCCVGLLLFNESGDQIILFPFLCVFTARKRSLRRLCFYRCLSFCPQGGGDVRGCSGGHAWLLLGGHAWLLWGDVHGCSWGACMVAPGCMCGCSWGGMCGCSGGHVWFFGGTCVVFSGGRVCFFR